MKYIALLYTDPTNAPAPGDADFGAMLTAYRAATKRFAADGVLVAADALESASTATTVRIRGGSTETLDGPFAESKEQLGGYYILDCPSLDDALRYAAMIPAAVHGSVELRPIMTLPE